MDTDIMTGNCFVLERHVCDPEEKKEERQDTKRSKDLIQQTFFSLWYNANKILYQNTTCCLLSNTSHNQIQLSYQYHCCTEKVVNLLSFGKRGTTPSC